MDKAVINPKSIVDNGILTNLGSESQIQQVGVDLRINKVFQVIGEATISKTNRVLPAYREILPTKLLTERKNETPIVMEECWRLQPGYYLWEGFEQIKLPENTMALLIHRSTLMRSGINIVSAIWDPGFSGPTGSNLNVLMPIKLERGACVAQIYFLNADAYSKYEGIYKDKTAEEYSQISA